MKTDKNSTIQELRNLLMSFSQERNWEKNYHPNHLAVSLIIEAAELLEEFQWKNDSQAYEKINKTSEKKRVAFEMVDVLYYLLMLANVMQIDLTEYIHLKLKNLESRYPKSKGSV